MRLSGAATRLEVAVDEAWQVSCSEVQLAVGAAHQVDTGLPRKEDQIEQQFAVFGLDVPGRIDCPARCKLIQQPPDVSKGYIRVFVGHRERHGSQLCRQTPQGVYLVWRSMSARLP